jgi:hypothetical protein
VADERRRPGSGSRGSTHPGRSSRCLLRQPDPGGTPVEPCWPPRGAVGQRAAEAHLAEVPLLDQRPGPARPDDNIVGILEVRAAEVRAVEGRPCELHRIQRRATQVGIAQIRVVEDPPPQLQFRTLIEDFAAKVCPAQVEVAQIERGVEKRHGPTAQQDGQRGLGFGGSGTERRYWSGRGFGRSWAAPVEVGDEHLGHGQPVVRGLLGDLLQPVDATELDLDPVAAQLIDRAGEPLAGLAVQGQLAGGGCLLPILGELLEAERRAGEDGDPGDRLQGGRAQVVAELDLGVDGLEPVAVAQAVQQLGGRRDEPARDDQYPAGQQRDESGQQQEQQGTEWSERGCQGASSRVTAPVPQPTSSTSALSGKAMSVR